MNTMKPLLLIIALLFIIPPVTAVSCDTWKFDGRAPWSPVGWLHGFGVVGNSLYKVDGDPDSPTGDMSVWISSDGIHWMAKNLTYLTPLMMGRQASSFTTFNNRLWITGGSNCLENPDSECTDVWSSVDGNVWTLINATAFSPGRNRAGFIGFKNKLWVIGGMATDEFGDPIFYNDTWWSDDGIMWHLQNASAEFPARVGPYVMSTGDTLWLMNGETFSGGGFDKIFNDTWYSNDGDVWYPGISTPWPKSTGMSYGYGLGTFWMSGGRTGGSWPQPAFPNTLYSSTNGITWNVANSPEFPTPYRSNFVEFNGKLFLYMGGTTFGTTNTFVSYIYECCPNGVCPQDPIEPTPCTTPSPMDITTEVESNVQGIVQLGVLAAIGVSLLMLVLILMRRNG